jgi:exopolyphosphatase/guanosine-5'-triphosphate,3'-diphosphate pyrophosphatase
MPSQAPSQRQSAVAPKPEQAMPIEYNQASAHNSNGLIAIIDIGSNSVRMVVYHALKRVPLPIFNEKYMCALGRGLARSGRLNPEGVQQAYKAIARFIVMANRLDVKSIDLLATAAVRDAEDGHKFVAELEAEHGVKVRIISGEQEAHYGAQGIIASIHQPLGLTADLGGGSMELATITAGAPGLLASTKLGGLRLYEESEGKPEKMQALIHAELKKVAWLNDLHPHMIYAIGGSFRALAKLHMRKTKYPLPILHEYVMSKRAINALVEKLAGLSLAQITALPGISAERAPTIMPSALVLQQLLHSSGGQQVMFSVSGIREGFFYELLDANTRAQDSLLASATDLAALIGRKGRYGDELYRWITPIFSNEPIAWQRLRKALCILSELAWSIDQNFRAEWAYNRIMQSSLKGIDHKERLMLALALFHRYQTKWKGEKLALELLDERERLWARCVGLGANLAYQLSGGKAGNLQHASLQVSGHDLQLRLDQEASPLRTAMVEKRVDGLGEVFSAFANFVI